MNTIKVRNIEIGSGTPKIIVPIVGVTKQEIIDEAKTFDSIPVDVVEWRADWFEGVFDFEKVEDVLKELRAVLGETPILMTFRTSKEGGEKSIEPEDYAKLNIKAAQTGYVDFIDVEIFTGDAIVTKIIDGAHAAGVKVIASNHDFHKTPEKSDIIYRLRKMQDMNADIPEDRSYAAEQERCFNASLCHRGNDFPLCGPSNHYHVDGWHRRYQPSLRRGIWFFHDLRRCQEGIRTGSDGRKGSGDCTGTASQCDVISGLSSYSVTVHANVPSN